MSDLAVKLCNAIVCYNFYFSFHFIQFFFVIQMYTYREREIYFQSIYHEHLEKCYCFTHFEGSHKQRNEHV